jgi:hypothetical protein
MAITRVVHRVRCRKKDNKQVWADVKVVDAFTVVEPGGDERMLWVRAKDAKPFIIDDTGGKNGKGELEHCTRVSHMELVKAPDDPSQKFYIEVLDALALQPPPLHDANLAGKGMDHTKQLHGLPAKAVFGRGPFAMLMPEKDATKLIVDKTGLDLASGSQNDASRASHVNLVTEKGNTDDKTDGLNGDAVPPKKMDWCATLRMDGINLKVPGGNIAILTPKDKQEELDTTVMTTDPTTGEPCPPDNTDPNIYVTFPVNDDPNAPSIGCNVKIPVRRDGQKPIDQGALWSIERISSSFRPWFWFAEVTTPLAFSFFGDSPRWAWRGFVLWNNYPVIWILAPNAPIQSMGQFGSPDLDTCARAGNWDSSFPPVPSEWLQAAPRGAGGSFAPFGILQMTHPPLGPLPDAVPYGLALGGNNGSEIRSGRPNIFQLCGLPQPPYLHPGQPWDPFNNPVLPPSAKDAETAAHAFRDNWNSVADGFNDAINIFVPSGHDKPIFGQPPGWHWAVPWYDPAVDIAGNGASFQNAIPPGLATVAFPIELYAPATIFRIGVDQLRPDWWDTTHLELYNNPINAFISPILPPFLWSNDPWIGTNVPPHPNPPSGP